MRKEMYYPYFRDTETKAHAHTAGKHQGWDSNWVPLTQAQDLIDCQYSDKVYLDIY